MTNMTKLVLDSQSLISEYAIWGVQYGDGRNKQDLRFGQYIHNTYHLVPDVAWNTENANYIEHNWNPNAEETVE